MPSSRFSLRRALVIASGLVLVFGAGGCDELNPDFDPDGGPICAPGERRCGAVGDVPEVCQSATEWTALSACWTGSGCAEGLCLPTEPFERCDHVSGCATATHECTVFVDPDAVTHLATFCVAPPNAGSRPGGQACSVHDECASGWCFRRVCFEACSDASQCTNTLHECALLDVTVDGVRENGLIHGCVPPAN